MYSRLFILLTALFTVTHGSIMVKSVDGSFVPWSFSPRNSNGSTNTNGSSGALTVRLTNLNDSAYVATVVMGKPQQQVPMAVSMSLNYISVATPPPGVNNATFYNPSVSSTLKPSNDVTSIQTLSGRAFDGRFAGETCSIQSSTSARVWGYNASIVLTNNSVTNDLYPFGSTGILGYGVNLPPGSPSNASLVGSFLPANFTYAVCGLELNHADDPVPDGALTMGSVDATAFTGNFTNVKVAQGSQVSWSVPFEGISYVAGGNTTQNASSGVVVASVDVLHTGIKVPTDMAQQIYSGIPGSQVVSDNVWSVPCNSTFQVTLIVSGTNFTIRERDTIQIQSNGTCFGAVTGGAVNVSEVGAPFLRNVYTQFGAEKASNGSVGFFVGFATKKPRQS